MKAHRILFVVAFCLVCLASFTSYATEVEAEAELVLTEVEAEIALDEEELGESCSVTVYCTGCCGPLVACTGNSCIGGSDWVECDGVRSYCHYRDWECEMDCEDDFFQCEVNCRKWSGEDPCGCEAAFDSCVWGCCFG